MDLTFDGQDVVGHHGLAGGGVVRLARVRPGVFVNRLLDGVRGHLDVGLGSVELPGEAGGGDRGGVACEHHLVVHLDGAFARHRHGFGTVWWSDRKKHVCFSP